MLSSYIDLSEEENGESAWERAARLGHLDIIRTFYSSPGNQVPTVAALRAAIRQ